MAKARSLIQQKLLASPTYRPYCGDMGCRSRYRVIFNGDQFECPKCGWVSNLDAEFMTLYKSCWGLGFPPLPVKPARVVADFSGLESRAASLGSLVGMKSAAYSMVVAMSRLSNQSLGFEDHVKALRKVIELRPPLSNEFPKIEVNSREDVDPHWVKNRRGQSPNRPRNTSKHRKTK